MPPGLTVTSSASNRPGPSFIETLAAAGPPVVTRTMPCIGWKRQKYSNVPSSGKACAKVPPGESVPLSKPVSACPPPWPPCAAGRKTMQEERHLEIGLAAPWIAHDQAAEQTEVHVVEDVGEVIVEGPCADRLLCHVERIAPLVARADRVAAAAVGVGHTERPRAVGIDAVDETVDVEAVREDRPRSARE